MATSDRNFKSLLYATIPWQYGEDEKISKDRDKKHKSCHQEELLGVEEKIDELYDKNKEGVFTIEEIDNLK